MHVAHKSKACLTERVWCVRLKVFYLFARLEVSLPLSDVLGVLLVKLLEFESLVFHQELPLLILHLLQLLDGCLGRSSGLFQLSLVLLLEAMLLSAVALLLSLLELKPKQLFTQYKQLQAVLLQMWEPFCKNMATLATHSARDAAV